MKEIREYLEKQLTLSKELNTILEKLDSPEADQKKLQHEETEKSKYDSGTFDKNNINSVDDRIKILKKKLFNMLSNPELKKNSDIFYPAYHLDKKLDQLCSDLDLLEKQVNKYYEASLSIYNNSTSSIKQENIKFKENHSKNIRDRKSVV